tara:strand:- start:875 stop:1849 length:975 start_codon:yes stop_codon:yes gene_type:complete
MTYSPNQYNMIKIAITGGLGHIGSSLIKELPNYLRESEITIIDNLSTQRYFSIFNLPSISKYKFIEGDIRELDLKSVLNHIDIVIHLAAITDAAGSFEKAKEVESNNYESTKKLIEACSETNTKIITLSSTSVYGSQSSLVDESCTASDLKPQSPYAETKLREEKIVQKWSQENNLKAITLRFGTIFGASPGMRFHTAVNKFCWQASLDQPITVWETALNQKRPYLDLCDAIAAIVHIINFDLFDGQIYNVLTENCTVKDIINEIRLIHNNVKIEFVKNKIMNQLSYEVSDEKFKHTGFNKRGSLRRGIRETLNLLKQANNLKY